jgi:hypothetical protein
MISHRSKSCSVDSSRSIDRRTARDDPMHIVAGMPMRSSAQHSGTFQLNQCWVWMGRGATRPLGLHGAYMCVPPSGLPCARARTRSSIRLAAGLSGKNVELAGAAEAQDAAASRCGAPGAARRDGHCPRKFRSAHLKAPPRLRASAPRLRASAIARLRSECVHCIIMRERARIFWIIFSFDLSRPVPGRGPRDHLPLPQARSRSSAPALLAPAPGAGARSPRTSSIGALLLRGK